MKIKKKKKVIKNPEDFPLEINRWHIFGTLSHWRGTDYR